jgi:flagellar FliL protein
MSDNDDLDLGDEGGGGGASSKKPSGLAALLPNLLKYVAIGLGATIFIITVCMITYRFMNQSGSSQTVYPQNSPWVGERPRYSFYTNIGSIRTTTKDPTPYAVVVEMVIGYDLNDKSVADELTDRVYELRDFVRRYFRGKMVYELQPENEAKIKQEIIEQLNTRILSKAKVRIITFNQIDVMEM